MRSHPTNPAGNDLPAWVEEKGLLAAIEASGYPAQSHVAGLLADRFHIVEEWGYIDRDSLEQRELDVHASRSLVENPSRVEPRVVLSIESKRSAYPYVFFQSVGATLPSDLPIIAGLPDDSVKVYSGDAEIDVAGHVALGLPNLPFVSQGPPTCASFSKAAPKRGGKLELSGDDPFNRVVLPLTKAMTHAVALDAFNPALEMSPLTLHLGVAVIDGPMLLVDTPENAMDPILVPWVRVVRNVAVVDVSRGQRRTSVIDVVHKDFLLDFVDNHVLPFAEEFGARVQRLGDVLLDGGEVDDLNQWTWDQVRPGPSS